MTRIFSLVVIIAACLLASTQSSANDGQISDAQLKSLGLGGMTKMSDTQGMQVRGKFLWGLQYYGGLTQQILNSVPQSVRPQVYDAMYQQNQILLQLFPNGIPGTPYGPYNPIIK